MQNEIYNKKLIYVVAKNINNLNESESHENQTAKIVFSIDLSLKDSKNR